MAWHDSSPKSEYLSSKRDRIQKNSDTKHQRIISPHKYGPKNRQLDQRKTCFSVILEVYKYLKSIK